jgi:hypothetical protein
MRPKDMRPKDMRRKDMRRKDMRRKYMRRKVLRLYANSYIYVETRYFASPDLRQFIYVDMRRKVLRLYANSYICRDAILRVSGPSRLRTPPSL